MNARETERLIIVFHQVESYNIKNNFVKRQTWIGAAVVALYASFELTERQSTFDTSLGQMSVGRMSIGRIAVGQMSVGGKSVGRMSVGRMSVG